MKLKLNLKLKEYHIVNVKDVKSYYFDKNYLLVLLNNGTKQHYRLTTVQSIKESK